MPKVNLTVAIADDHLDHLMAIAEALQAQGLEIHQVMEMIGVITGSCETAQVKALTQVEGVESVETERPIQLAPPDSPIQ